MTCPECNLPFWGPLVMPEGWTLNHEKRVVAYEDADSAFTDGFQWAIRDADGERPPQAEWPTEWRDVAIRYSIALAARRAAVNDPKPGYAPASQTPSLLRVPHAEYVAPEDWDGLPHERPGLYRRNQEK